MPNEHNSILKFKAAYNDLIKVFADYERITSTSDNYLSLHTESFYGKMKDAFETLIHSLSNLNVPLNIGLLGKFNSGKSSFINALFQHEIAVIDSSEMNYYLSHITYGEQLCVTLKFKDGHNRTLTIEEANSLLHTMRDDQNFRSNILNVLYEYPFQELVGVNIWDTPGLGSTNTVNRDLAVSAMKDLDVVLWVMDSTVLGDSIDKDYILGIVSSNTPIICIVNKIDLLSEYDDSEQRIHEFIDEHYSEVFKKTFLCSSRMASSPDGNYEYKTVFLDIMEYLNENILKHKKKLVYTSLLNRSLNALENIDNVLENRYHAISTSLTAHNDFKEKIYNYVHEHTPKLKQQWESFVDNKLLKSEIDAAIYEIQTSNVNNGEDIQKIVKKHITDKAVKAFSDELIQSIKADIENLWKRALKVFNREMDEEYYEFNFANQSKVNPNSIDLETTMKNFDTEIAAFGIGASIGLAGALAAAASIGDAILSAFGVGGAFALATVLVKIISHGMKDHTGDIRDKVHSVSETIKSNYKKEFLQDDIYQKLPQLYEAVWSKIEVVATKQFLQGVPKPTLETCLVSIDQVRESTVGLRGYLQESLTINETDFNKYDFDALTQIYIDPTSPNQGISQLEKVLSRASGYCDIIDPYFSDVSLDWLIHLPSDIPIRILLYHLDKDMSKHTKFKTLLNKLRERRKGVIEVKVLKYKKQNGTPLHDRYIFTSRYGLQMGNGFDSIGRKDVLITRIANHKELRISIFENLWSSKEFISDGEKRILASLSI